MIKHIYFIIAIYLTQVWKHLEYYPKSENVMIY